MTALRYIKIFFLITIFHATIVKGQIGILNGDKRLGPIIEFEKLAVDLDTITYEEAISTYFFFKCYNKGDMPLFISYAGSSGFLDWVECIFPQCPILPGDSGLFKLRIAYPRLNYFNKSFSIYPNSDQGRIDLRVKGLILTPQHNEQIKK